MRYEMPAKQKLVKASGGIREWTDVIFYRESDRNLADVPAVDSTAAAIDRVTRLT
jgi:hypothetical protein